MKINGKDISEFKDGKIPISELEESLDNVIWKIQSWAKYNLMFGNKDKGKECLLFIYKINKEFETNYLDTPEICLYQNEAEVGRYGNKTSKYWLMDGDKVKPIFKNT